MKKILAFLICICLFISAVPFANAAEYNRTDEISVVLDVDGHRVSGDAFNVSYENNLYISLRSLAKAFSNSGKKFGFDFCSTKADGDYFVITSGADYIPPVDDDGEEIVMPKSSTPFSLVLNRNRLFVDGGERKYYTFRYGNPENLYMSVTDIALLFDISTVIKSDGSVCFDSGSPFSISFSELGESGYCDALNSALAGDLESGEILFSVNSDISFPIASVSKLMSYLIIAEAIESGQISADDSVTVSANVQKTSEAEDGIILMKEGDVVPLRELLTAMMVASSNEAALALAEHVSGSEAAFVRKMNARARSLGLSSSVFYNCNGLPKFYSSVLPVKRQNRMSSEDLFTLSCYILKNYPEITSITSLQYARMESLDYTTANSNPLVFNIAAEGLKTGSTKASGQCIVANKDGRVVIVLGAEDAAVRGRAAQLLFKAHS